MSLAQTAYLDDLVKEAIARSRMLSAQGLTPQKAPWQPNSSKQLYRILLLPCEQQLTIAHTQLDTRAVVCAGGELVTCGGGAGRRVVDGDHTSGRLVVGGHGGNCMSGLRAVT